MMEGGFERYISQAEYALTHPIGSSYDRKGSKDIVRGSLEREMQLNYHGMEVSSTQAPLHLLSFKVKSSSSTKKRNINCKNWRCLSIN